MSPQGDGACLINTIKKTNKQWPRLLEHHNHWWRVLGVRVRPGNQIPVVTVEAFLITKTKEGSPSAQQRQRDADCLLCFPRCGTPRVRTTGSNNQQRVLQGCPPSPTWCCAVQEKGLVVIRKLALPSRQCSSTFLAIDSDFFVKKTDSCASTGSLISWCGPCDFWLFTLSRGHWKERDFRQERTLWQQRQPS